MSLSLYWTRYMLLISFVFLVWLIYTSLFMYDTVSFNNYRNVTELIKDAFEWNFNHIMIFYNSLSSYKIPKSKADVPFCLYMATFTGFVAYFIHWALEKIKQSERKPHPLVLNGKKVSQSVTCNPDEKDFETIDSSIHTLADVRNRCCTFGDKEALFHAKQWISYSSVVRISEVIASVVDKYSNTHAPVCIIGDFSSIKCSAILGLNSKGRSVVFVAHDTESTEIAHILDEHHCEIVLIKHSRLGQLEDALKYSLSSSLRVVLFTDDAYIEKVEVGNTLRAEETLDAENNLSVLSLSHELLSQYKDNEVQTTVDTTAVLPDSPAVIVYNSNKEAVTLTHRNIVAAASALASEYKLTDTDVILAEPISIVSTLSLFISALLCGARFSITDRIMEICAEVQPTIISATNTSYYAFYKELSAVHSKHPISSCLLRPLRHFFRYTKYFKYVSQQRVSQLVGTKLRLCLYFYTYRPMSKTGHNLLTKTIGVPISLIFGTTETCGICTHSLCCEKKCPVGYAAKPFMCNSLRLSERKTLLIEGSNITDCSRLVDIDGTKWLDSGISILYMKDYLIYHKMPLTFCNTISM